MNRTTVAGISWVLLMAGVSGCFGSDDEDEPATTTTPTTTPTTTAETTSMPTTTAPTTTTTAATTRPPPGPAYNKTYELGTSAVSATAMNVQTAWTTLNFTIELSRTAACYSVSDEPPVPPNLTATPPSVNFTSKSGSLKVGFTLQTNGTNPNACDVTGPATAVVKLNSKEAANELGEWKVEVKGRGTNARVTLTVTGR